MATPTKRIFIVEDEALIALELADLLRERGFEVCGRAMRAADALRDIPNAHPDLVLMDVRLGGEMTGFDVAERLRGVVDVPIIFLTAYSDGDSRSRAGWTRAFAYLLKPVDPSVLAESIELALLRHQGKH